MDNGFKPEIVALCCENSGYQAADMAGNMGLLYPEGFRIVRVPCGGKIDSLYVLKALEEGADGVALFVCYEENCKFLIGNIRAKKRVDYVRGILKEIGVPPERVELFYTAANKGYKFSEDARGMYERIRALGPNEAGRKRE
ncbi:MAG: hydrogenase iron-sulfur subunit [bacterium]